MATKVNGNSAASLTEYISKMDDRLSDGSKTEYTTPLKTIVKKIDLGDNALTPDVLIAKLASLVEHNEIAPATFRLNKSAIMYWLAEQAKATMASGGDYSDYATAFDQLREIRHANLTRGAGRTSSQKLKFFSSECATALASYARQRGHRAPNAVRADAFVKANLLVGLRPVEWFDASFASYFVRTDDGEIARDAQGRVKFEHMMVIENAKATHGRGNGDNRELILYDITAEELKAIVHFRDVAIKFRERHPPEIPLKKLTGLLYRPMNHMIRRALLATGYAGSDIPSCYSTRHQLVSDFKASKVGKRETAAFFGHSSDYTHQEHYGNKSHGNTGVRFKPSPESLDHVTDRSLRRQPEVISPQLAADVDQWVSEHESRKTATNH